MRAKPFVAQALRAANRAGGLKRGRAGGRASRGSFGRGRAASLRAGRHLGPNARRVAVKARVVRHGPRATPLKAHLAYLARDGVTRDGEPGRAFSAAGDDVEMRAFAERCADDRHHFRFIVSPEDAAELSDLETYTRDLMATAERDLGTGLDWIAVDHWNTPHPHIHVLVRGRDETGEDLVISRDYIGTGLRARASERATLELGPRSDREIEAGWSREVDADRWTGLDRSLQREAVDGIVDLRPRFGARPTTRDAAKIGRMRKLEALGLADPVGSSRWHVSETAEPKLRALQRRGDIIARMQDALGDRAEARGTTSFALDQPTAERPVLGRLAARGLDDELTGSAFVVIDGVDGRTHHVAVDDLEAASDVPIGGVVEARWTTPKAGDPRLLIAVRSDLDLDRQVAASGATWLDRQLVGKTRAELAEAGFGAEVREALTARTDHLVREGLAEREDRRVRFSRGLLTRLRETELQAVRDRLTAETGLAFRATEEGAAVSGTVARRVTLTSGRFAMIDDGTGFQLVPWTQPLARRLGQHVSGVATATGVDWSFARSKTLGR